MKLSSSSNHTGLAQFFKHFKLLSLAFAIGFLGLGAIHIISPKTPWLEKSIAATWLAISFWGTFYAERRGWVLSSRLRIYRSRSLPE